MHTEKDDVNDRLKEIIDIAKEMQSDVEDLIDNEEHQEGIEEARQEMKIEIADKIDAMEFVSNSNSCTPEYIKEEIIKMIREL